MNAHAPPDDITDTFTLTSHLVRTYDFLVFFLLLFNSHSLFLVLLLLNILYIYFFHRFMMSVFVFPLTLIHLLGLSSLTPLQRCSNISFTLMLLQLLPSWNAFTPLSLFTLLFFPPNSFLCICIVKCYFSTIIQCPVLSFKFGIASLSIYDFCSLFFAVHTSYQSILRRICIPTSNNYVLTSTFRASDVLLVYIIENVHHLKIPSW